MILFSLVIYSLSRKKKLLVHTAFINFAEHVKYWLSCVIHFICLVIELFNNIHKFALLYVQKTVHFCQNFRRHTILSVGTFTVYSYRHRIRKTKTTANNLQSNGLHHRRAFVLLNAFAFMLGIHIESSTVGCIERIHPEALPSHNSIHISFVYLTVGPLNTSILVGFAKCH